jgi:hypothetical protein
MAHINEGLKELPAYAARATTWYKIVLDDVGEAERALIVQSGVGPQNVPIHFRADGIVIFEFDKSERYSGGVVEPYEVSDGGLTPNSAQRAIEARDAIRERRFRYMTAFLTCFNIALNRSNPLFVPCSSDHYIWARFESGQWRMMDNATGGLSDFKGYMGTVDATKLNNAMATFRSIRGDRVEESLQALDLFYRTAFHMSNHEFQTVLILGWALIEACQTIVWENYVRGGYKATNPHSNIIGARLKLLLTDRNFTASIKSQILALSGIFSDLDLEEIDKVRRKRNSFMHGLSTVTVSDAFETMSACRVVAKMALGLELMPFGSPGGWDYGR